MKKRVRICAALALAATIGVSACAKKKPAPPPASPPPETPAPPPTEDEIFARESLDDLNRAHPLADAYFDLDSSQIRSDAQPILQKDAEWMKRWPSTKVLVEGHCDSRGSAEYNLALGDRRSTAVRDYLVSLGVAGDRVQIVSKGKEQQVCSEENETCWQQNRRGHFLVTAK